MSTCQITSRQEIRKKNMRFVQYQNCISPHQVPLAREIAKRVGESNFRYVYRDLVRSDRLSMGWRMHEDESWFLHEGTHADEARNLVESADVILTGFRDITLFKNRSKKGLVTLYASERWFKPFYPFSSIPLLDSLHCTGRIRMFVPKFRRMANDIVRLIEDDPRFMYLPLGIHAKTDMMKICSREDKIWLWGYFVDPTCYSIVTSTSVENSQLDRPLRVLYVGRLLKLKHVDTVIRVVKAITIEHMAQVQLLVVGNGNDRERLEHLSRGLPVSFMDSVPIDEVRALMRMHDVLVFTSDGRDGWGAVVNEALEEGMLVFGTYETGASATVLPVTQQFHVGDVKALTELVLKAYRREIKKSNIGEWSAAKGASRLLEMLKDKLT